MQPLRSLIGGAFWGRTFASGGMMTWMAEPSVRRYINQSVTGSPDIWPIEWLQRWVGQQPLAHCLSLGCGDGALERDLARKGLCGHIMGLDISHTAIEIARAQAVEAGTQHLEYATADLNALRLERASLQAAFFHQSLHHVEALEHCLAVIRDALVDDGFLYLDEYVGPSRSEWRPRLLAEAQAVYQLLPREVRRRSRLKLPVDWRDPTEAIRSSDILPTVRSLFRVVEERPYGGNLFSVIYPHLRFEGVSAALREQVLDTIVAAEREHLQSGRQSFYTVLICSRCQSAA